MLTNANKDLRASMILADQLALCWSVLLAAVGRLYLPLLQHTPISHLGLQYVAFWYLSLAVLWYFCMSGTGNYEIRFSADVRHWNAIKGVALFTLIVLAVAFFRWTLFSRGAVLLFFLIASASTSICRRYVPKIIFRWFSEGENSVLLIGDGKQFDELQKFLEQELHLKVVRRMAVLDVAGECSPSDECSALYELLQTVRPSEVIFGSSSSNLDRIGSLLNVCNACRTPWHFVPSFSQLVFANIRTQILGGLPLIGTATCSMSGFNLLLKRMLDVCLASIILILTSPIMIAAAIAVRLTSPGPVIFVQKRVGLRGRVFDFYKFRTMYVNQDDSSHRQYAQKWIENTAYAGDDKNPTFKIVGDKRVTAVGRILRRYSIDELPQMFNVFKGDMSLVGPRPALSYELEMYKEWHLERLQGVPGLTGLWQVAGRNQLSFDEMVKLDLEYLRTWSLAQDFKLILRTVPVVLLGTGH